MPSLTAGNLCHQVHNPRLIVTTHGSYMQLSQLRLNQLPDVGEVLQTTSCQLTGLSLHSVLSSQKRRRRPEQPSHPQNGEKKKKKGCCLKTLHFGVHSKSQLMDLTTVEIGVSWPFGQLLEKRDPAIHVSVFPWSPEMAGGAVVSGAPIQYH